MAEIGFGSWAIVIVVFGLLVFYSFMFGTNAVQIVFRLRSKDRRESYEKWGVVSDLFRPVSDSRFAAWCVGVAGGTALLGIMAFLSTDLLIEETLPGKEQIYYTAMIALYGFFVGFTVESERIAKITEMPRKLDDLGEAFHRRFPVSELLSMYESLRPAPPLFWEEYAGLTNEDISEETNRSFRRRALPYSNIQSGRYNRTIIVVAVLTLLLTGASAAIQLFA